MTGAGKGGAGGGGGPYADVPRCEETEGDDYCLTDEERALLRG
jgi:hypothetical protein